MTIVSVIIPGWKAEKYIHRAILSARRQTINNIEIIVVDDASPDRTWEASKAAAEDDPRVRLIRRPVNGGPAAARNSALREANGEFIAVLDCDDLMKADRLERMVNVAKATNCHILADQIIRVTNPDQLPQTPPTTGAPRQVSFEEYVLRNRPSSGFAALGYLKPIFKRSFIEQYGVRQNEQTWINEDYHFMIELLAFGARFVLTPDQGYYFWVRNEQTSANPKSSDIDRWIAEDADFVARHQSRLTASMTLALQKRKSEVTDLRAYLRTKEAILAKNWPEAAKIFTRPQSLRFLGGTLQHYAGRAIRPLRNFPASG
jgi:succinoglycan biosynthesis protein ExoO